MATKDVNHIKPLDNFVQGGIDYLPGDFMKEKENLVKFLTIYLQRLANLDLSLVNLAEGRLLNNAAGINLDEIGEQYGLERNGMSDTNYRAIITILLATSARYGTREDVIGTLAQLFGYGNFSTWKGGNYRVDINVNKTCFDLESTIDEIEDMLPLPTHLRLTESYGVPFGFNGDNTAEGFSSVADTIHGEPGEGNGGWASIVYTPDGEADFTATTIYCDSISIDVTAEG